VGFGGPKRGPGGGKKGDFRGGEKPRISPPGGQNPQPCRPRGPFNNRVNRWGFAPNSCGGFPLGMPAGGSPGGGFSGSRGAPPGGPGGADFPYFWGSAGGPFFDPFFGVNYSSRQHEMMIVIIDNMQGYPPTPPHAEHDTKRY